MDYRKWLSLNQLLEDISEGNFVSEDCLPLVSQLVLELALDHTCMKTSNSQRHSEEVFSLHQEVVGESEEVS